MSVASKAMCASAPAAISATPELGAVDRDFDVDVDVDLGLGPDLENDLAVATG
jgi:hypothetical protein